jgi:SAM-dependent methyltransferase
VARQPGSARAFFARLPGVAIARQWWHDRDQLALYLSRKRGSALAVLEPFTATGDDRFPMLFDALADALKGIPEPRLLSFGCADGREVRALRRRMPKATIVGVDVNPRALGRARDADRNPRSCYLIGDRPPPGEPFDAVVALSIFRHRDLEAQGCSNSAEVLPFARAAAVFARLDAALRPGGVLASGDAHVRLADLPGGDHYGLLAESEDLAPSRPLFGPDNRLIEGQSALGGLFRKRG